MSSTHGRIVRSDFRPHPLLRGPHAQTIAPVMLRTGNRLELRRIQHELPDGDFVELGWAGEEHANGPIAILIHGLGGSLESHYIAGLGRRLVAAGWRVCALLQRGAGLLPNRLPQIYNHGFTQDLRHLWHSLQQGEPHTFLAAVGWSLGGNVLLKALAEEASNSPLRAAYAVSVPFNLAKCEKHLRKGFARVYQRRLLNDCKQMVLRKQASALLPPNIRLQSVLAARNFSELDDAFTAPLNGYADAQDYYAQAACGQYLSSIRTPTRILQALDDPFMAADIIPRAEALSPSVTLELADNGGHVGFISRNEAGMPMCWSEHAICSELNRSWRKEFVGDGEWIATKR